MAAEERRGDGVAERESRFVNLLQPNRDMATNWSVDVGKQLEIYLDELKATGLFDDGECPLNFAEAALLIQGSIQVYSRKVEYLYNLVLRALDFLAQKKQGQEGDKPSSQENDQDCNAAHETEENFLNLDDEVPEEADIDFLDKEGDGSVSPLMKVPASLLVTEAESLDMAGDAGELASYHVAKCTMYRDFLLLDPCDTETVDKYLESEEHRRRERGEASAVPSNSVPRGNSFTPTGNLGTPYGPEGGNAAAEKNATTSPGEMDMGEADWQGDGDEGMMWDDSQAEVEIHEAPKDKFPGKGEPGAANPGAANSGAANSGAANSGAADLGAAEADHYIDPWAPLNPHEPGTLPMKPFKKGPTQRTHKPKQDPVCDVRRNGVFLPEFAKALQAKERQERAKKRGVEPPLSENLRSSFDEGPAADAPLDQVHDEGVGGALRDSYDEDNAWGGDDEPADYNDGANTTSFGQPQSAPPMDDNLFRPCEDDPNIECEVEDENMSLEDLCRAHVDSVLQKLAESQVRTGLTARVTTWKNNIEASLKEDESRPPFDIHVVGDHLLKTLSTSATTCRSQDGNEEIDGSFTYLVSGQPKDEVARSFSALLQLVNNGNVVIDKGSVGSGSYCFTADNPFRVKLLNSQNCHEGMFQHMVPPDVTHRSGKSQGSRPQPPADDGGPSLRGGTPVMVSDRRSPVVSYARTPGSGLRIRSSTAIFMSSGSARKSSRKRGQSVAGKIGGFMDTENRGIGIGTPEKGYYTPVKLTPNRRQSKRKPLQTIQV